MKTRVILVGGSTIGEVPLVQPLMERFYRRFNLEPGIDHWEEDLGAFLRARGFEVEVFEWNGSKSRFLGAYPAAKRLARRVKELLKGKERLVLLGQSMGGLIALRAARRVGLGAPHMVLSVCAPHARWHGRGLKGARFVNVFSPDDRYLNMVRHAFWYGAGAAHVRRAENVALPGLGHSRFNYNGEVAYEGAMVPLFEVYVRVMGHNPMDGAVE